MLWWLRVNAKLSLRDTLVARPSPNGGDERATGGFMTQLLGILHSRRVLTPNRDKIVDQRHQTRLGFLLETRAAYGQRTAVY